MGLRHFIMFDLMGADLSVTSALQQKQHREMVDVVTKQCIIGISITVISGGFAISIFIAETFNPETDVDLMWCYTVRAVEGLFIAILLYLGLKMNESCCQNICGFCHRRCFQCAQRQFKKDATGRYYAMNELML